MIKEGEGKGYAVPMVAVYLLGHRVGDIDKAVVYVNHKALDYDGKEVENGMDDPFINSLTHDSILVQIPLLHGKINNRLDKVLSVFDQSQRDKKNQQMLCLEGDKYKDDSDMMYIVHRLGLATMSANIRQEMNDEDEYYSAIEARDTQVMKLNKIISEQANQVNEQATQINEQATQINEQATQINEQATQINEQATQIKSMAQGMLENGMPLEMVAKMMNRTPEEVRALLGK